MRKWQLTVSLDGKRELPLFLQLASALTDDIRSGRLRPGDALPGTRALAQRLGVHRNTIIAGYRELEAEGLVERVPDPSDGRAWLATVTAAGRAAFKRAVPVYLAGIDAHFNRYLSAAEQETIARGLQRVIDAHDAQADPRR